MGQIKAAGYDLKRHTAMLRAEEKAGDKARKKRPESLYGGPGVDS